jgi:hypothetical protein
MDNEKISVHKLVSDYSVKARLKKVIIGWIIFIFIYAGTRLHIVQDAMINFADKMTVDWVTSVVGFIIKGLWLFLIPLVIGTVITFVKKQTFDELIIYTTGIGFGDKKNGEVQYVPYESIKLSYGKMQNSFWIETKVIPIKLTEYGWGEFSQPDVLKNNLQRYGTWNK